MAGDRSEAGRGGGIRRVRNKKCFKLFLITAQLQSIDDSHVNGFIKFDFINFIQSSLSFPNSRDAITKLTPHGASPHNRSWLNIIKQGFSSTSVISTQTINLQIVSCKFDANWETSKPSEVATMNRLNAPFSTRRVEHQDGMSGEKISIQMGPELQLIAELRNWWMAHTKIVSALHHLGRAADAFCVFHASEAVGSFSLYRTDSWRT